MTIPRAQHAPIEITDIPHSVTFRSQLNDLSWMSRRAYVVTGVYPTNWARLNKNLMGGLQPGKMYVIAGRPGVGKSAFSNQLIFDLLDKNADKNVVVLYWSFEMPGEQQILRAGSKDTKLQTFELLSVENKLTQDKYNMYVQAVQKYKEYPIYFCSIPQDMEKVKNINEQVFPSPLLQQSSI